MAKKIKLTQKFDPASVTHNEAVLAAAAKAETEEYSASAMPFDVDDLETVSPDFREFYEANGKGGFRLTKAGRKGLENWQQGAIAAHITAAKTLAETSAEADFLTAELKRLRTYIVDDRTEQLVTDALRDSGIDRKLWSPITKLALAELAPRMIFETDNSLRHADGWSGEEAVATWLQQSATVQSMQPTQKPTKDLSYTSACRGGLH